MDNIFKHVPAGGFESSTVCTPEFTKFFNAFREEMVKELKKVEATEIEMHKGHFYISGFFKVGEVLYYFSIPDVRGLVSTMLIRTARHNKDYVGGTNNFVMIKDGMFNYLQKRKERNETHATR